MSMSDQMRAEKQAKDREERRRKRDRLKHIFATFLSSPEGSEVLDDLLDFYDPDDIVGDDMNTTYFNLGARSVVRAMKSLRDQRNQE